MERASKAVKTMFADMTQRGERSTLFWWFVENHDEFLEGSRRQRVQWAVVVQRAVGLGLTNREGAPPSRKLAKLTWQRAKSYVASHRETALREPQRSAASFSIPRSVDVHPIPAAPPSDWQTSETYDVVDPAGALASVGRNATLPVGLQPPPASTKQPAMVVPAPVWTPEQIAHRDAVLAKARARLAHTDRFLNLRE